jgi:hypothetical protein
LDGIKQVNILFRGVWNTICDPFPFIVFGIKPESSDVIKIIATILGMLINVGICYGGSLLNKNNDPKSGVASNIWFIIGIYYAKRLSEQMGLAQSQYEIIERQRKQDAEQRKRDAEQRKRDIENEKRHKELVAMISNSHGNASDVQQFRQDTFESNKRMFVKMVQQALDTSLGQMQAVYSFDPLQVIQDEEGFEIPMRQSNANAQQLRAERFQQVQDAYALMDDKPLVYPALCDIA